MTDVYRALASARRIEILESLQRQPGQTVSDLADANGVHVNTIRGHLRCLIDNGLVVARPEHRSRRGRPQMLYMATEGIDGEGTVSEQKVAAALRRGELLRAMYPDLAPQPPEIQDQLDVLEDHLDQCGFEPTVHAERMRIELAGCPYPDLLASHKETLCRVHFNLIRSIVARVDGPVRAEELLPFEDDGVCVIRLGLAEAGHDSPADDGGGRPAARSES